MTGLQHVFAAYSSIKPSWETRGRSGLSRAGPFALAPRGRDLVADPLGGQLAFELGKGQQDVQGQPPHRRRGIELLRDSDEQDRFRIGDGSPALRARAPGIIAGRRDPEHVAQDRHRIVDAAIFDEAESHFGTPAKIAIDFFKISRSMRSRSFSRCKRAISAAWSPGGSAACVVGRRAAAGGSPPAPRWFTQRRSTESRRPSSLATDPIERPLEATRSIACRL